MSYMQIHNREPLRRWRKINTWSVKGPLIVVAVLFGMLGAALNWDSVPFAAGVAIVLPVIGFRDYWREWRFWITIGLLGALQVPLVVALDSLVARLKFQGMLAFGIIDCILVILAVSFACSESKKR
jgi:hypothetical protein